jgi:uncharacterized membrane protein
MYDAELGRFTAEDPALDGDNWYVYAANNPLRYIDPTGELITPANVIGALIGLIGGAVIGTAIANYFKLCQPWKALVIASVSVLMTVIGWFAGPAIYAAVKPLVIKAIAAGTIVVTKAIQWILDALRISNAVDLNKLNHIFNNASHKLSGFLNSFGGNQTNAFNAVQKAIDKLHLTAGVFNQIAVTVNGYVIHVNGIVENGVTKIGTFFIK